MLAVSSEALPVSPVLRRQRQHLGGLQHGARTGNDVSAGRNYSINQKSILEMKYIYWDGTMAAW